MRYSLAKESVLKWLETPSVYHIKNDELYELDDESFEFLKNCPSQNSNSAKNSKFINYCLKEGILTKEKISAKRPRIIKSPAPSLRYLELQITDRCNLRCRHCYIGGRRSRELSSKNIIKILSEFEAMQGLRVLITGGEPLLHSEFKEINKMLPEFFVRKVLFTNGMLLTRDILKKLNVDEIQLSIDGLENAHDSLRDKGAFKQAMKALKLSIDAGFDVSVSTMVHPENLSDFDKMEKLFKKTGLKDWTVDIPCITGRLEKNPEFQISHEEGGRYLKYGFGSGLHAGASGFACGLYLMSVTAEGKISKCTFYADKAVGTIKNGLKKCWQRIKPVSLNRLKCDCAYIEICRGGCRYRAELLGNPLGKDLYRCALYTLQPS